MPTAKSTYCDITPLHDPSGCLNHCFGIGVLMMMMLGGRLVRYFGIAAEGNLDISLLFTIIGYNLPYF